MTGPGSRARRSAHRVTRVVGSSRGDGLFRDGSILVLAAIVGGGVNYLYQIVMGRLLGPTDYGVFGSLFALTYLLLIVSAGVGFCATKFVAEHDGAARVGFVRGFGLRVVLLTAALFAGLVVASPALSAFLHIGDPSLVVVMGIMLLVGPVTAVQTGTLRGLESFYAMGGLKVGIAAAKFVAGVVLVWAGFGVYGAVGAPSIAGALGIAVAVVFLRRWYLGRGDFDRFDAVHRYAGPSLLVAFCFTVPTNADVVIVKHLFSAHQAGLYTSVSVFGKVLVFLPVGIAWAMFPKAAKGERDGVTTQGLLRRGLLYTAGVVALAAAALVVAPGSFLAVLYGPEYLQAADILRWYAVAMVAFSLCVVMLHYALAVNDLRFVKAFTVMTVVEIGLMYVTGSSVLDLVGVLLGVNLVAAAVGWLLLRDGRSPLSEHIGRAARGVTVDE